MLWCNIVTLWCYDVTLRSCGVRRPAPVAGAVPLDLGVARAGQHFSQDVFGPERSDTDRLGGGGAAEAAVNALGADGLLRGQTTCLPPVRP